MTSDNITITLIVLFKCSAVVAALVCAFMLAKEGRDGWGWFLFAALCIAPGGIKID